MADHSDHNYYTRSNRESQIPDYDVNLSEPADNSVLPSFAYRRQSREQSPRGPSIAPEAQQYHVNGDRRLNNGSIRSEASQDPHEFYRQYRESFQRRPESVYGQFDMFQTPVGGGIDSMAAVRQRQTPAAGRVNGYNSTPVTERWNRNMANHNTPSSGSERTTPRSATGQRGDIRALVKKFDSVRDESPPASLKPGSRSTSGTHLAGSQSSTPKSFKSRTSIENRPSASASLGSRQTRDSVGRLGLNTSTQSTNRLRKSSHVGSSVQASQSMTNLSPREPPQRPLFGEVTQDNANLTDPGFGIPGSNRRRGSEGALQRSQYSDDPTPASSSSVEASSPSAWYMGVTPSLDGINLDKPIPNKKSGIHRRSRSDMGMGPLTLATHSNNSGKPISILSPPQEIPTPSPGRTSRPPSYSRIPVSTRRTSVNSDSGNSSGYRTPTRPATALPTNIRLPPDLAIATPKTPRRSPRYRAPSPPRQSNDKLAAYVAEASPPLKSPPLRSSRPRMSIANATTAASRARNNSDTNGLEKNRPPSKIPNLPANANMEQRRQMIRRDFTKSWHEKEEKFKRQSLYLQQLGEMPLPAIPSPTKVIASLELAISSAENTDVFATPDETPRKQRELTIDTDATKKLSEAQFVGDDSPTLGTADFQMTRKASDSSIEPASAATEDTLEEYFGQEFRKTIPHSQAEDSRVAERSNTPKLTPLSPQSARGDGESIHIMLGDSPEINHSSPPKLTSGPVVVPRLPTPKLQTAPVIEKKASLKALGHDSISTTASHSNDIPWSPTSYLTGDTSRDRESGNSIESLLETYQESEPRRLFSQSPGLARAGGWDNQKVTRMYLQSRKRTPDLEAPPTPNFQGMDDKDILQPAKMDMPPAQTIPRSRSPRTEAKAASSIPSEPSPQPSLEVPKAEGINHRASLSHRDDFENASPSMLDWFHDHQSKNGDSRPRSKLSDGFLPDIPGGGLGIIDMNMEMKSDLPLEMPADLSFVSELHTSPQRPKENVAELPQATELSSSPSRRVAEAPGENTPPRKPVPIKSTKSLQSFVDATKPLPEPSEIKINRTSSTPVNGAISIKRPSISSETQPKVKESIADLPQDDESKRLRRRLNIIKELINTESTYSQDMTVVVDIYKGTCNVVLNSVQDERALFINAPDIVAFSTTFLDALKGAAKSVYVLPKSKRWRSKRDSSATQDSAAEETMSINTLDMTDEEKDRLTNIGSAFLEHLPEMERCYTEYLKNSETSNAKLKALQQDEKVKVWLDECCVYAKDLTAAWSLDSLLVKPLQRITKYPLLLKELCDVTPENHPDFVKLDTAAREISGVSKRINEAKRRMEMVEKVTQAERTKKKDDSRLNFAFGRRSDKYKITMEMQDQFQDREYNQISDKFGTHFFKLQIVMRDVEMYIVDVQKWVDKFNGVSAAMEAYFDVGATTYPDLESKWRRFRSSMRDMQMTALQDHIGAVRKFVVDPMATLLKLHDGPQRLMDKRKKRIADFVKYKLMQDRGEKLDKKTIEAADLFKAVNDTLKDELPRLFEMTSRLVEACLNNFVQLQLQWQSVWKRKMIQAIELAEVPRSFSDIISDFQADFRFTEAHVLSLGICDGSVLAGGTSFLPLASQGTTLVGDSRRPSTTATENSGRIRAASSATAAPSEVPRTRGYSGTVGLSPMLPSPDLGRPTEGFGLANHLNVNPPRPVQGLRVRASSTASSRSPVTPEVSSFRGVQQTPQGTGYGRPSTSTGPTYEPAAYSQQPLHGQPAMYQASRENSLQSVPGIQPYQALQPSPGLRTSGVFSSAMPMSDSPPPPTDNPGTQEFNVLFLAASVYEFNIDRARREAGYPYLTYVAGEIFDVIAEKGELWLAKNQDDEKNQIGWIWNKHFAKLAS